MLDRVFARTTRAIRNIPENVSIESTSRPMGDPVEGPRMLTTLCVLGILAAITGRVIETCAKPDPHQEPGDGHG